MTDLAKKLEDSLSLAASGLSYSQRVLDAKTIAERLPTREQFMNKCVKFLVKGGIQGGDLYDWIIAKLTGGEK